MIIIDRWKRRQQIRRLHNNPLETIMTTLFEMVEAAQADIVTLKTAVAALAPSDPTAAINAAIAPVEAQVNALAALVGTPAAPATGS